MHRTEGDGYLDEGGLRRFVDQDVPTYDGTVDTAEYNNAVQEELCNIVELCGGTLNGGGPNGTAAGDRAAGWRQVYDAIFQDGNIDDNAIDELTFGVIAPPIAYVDGSEEWHQDTTSLQYIDGDYQMTLGDTDILFEDTTDSSNQAGVHRTLGPWARADDFITRYHGKGIHYTNGPGNSASFPAAKVRLAAWDITGITWVEIGSGLGIYYASGLNFLTDLPIAVPLSGIYRATFRIDNAITVEPMPCVPAMREVAASGFYTVIWMKVLISSSGSPPPTEGTLIIEYDANNLTSP